MSEPLELLHEVWLAVHVHRFDAQNGKTSLDFFYAGVQDAERRIEEVAERYGVTWHQLRDPSRCPACHRPLPHTEPETRACPSVPTDRSSQ